MSNYKYWNHHHKILISLDWPLMVPLSSLNINAFGFPFPNLQCYFRLQCGRTNSHRFWLDLIESLGFRGEVAEVGAQQHNIIR